MQKDKRNKVDSTSKAKHDISDEIIELILWVVFLGIGVLVCWGISSIFSIDFSIDMDNFDADTFVLIGIISLVAIVAIISFLIGFIKKLKDKK